MESVRSPRRTFALIPAAIAILAIGNLTVPYFALAPGPAQDVNELLTISGTRTYPPEGRLLLTTVSLRTVRVADAALAMLDPLVAVVPRRAIMPPDTSDAEQDRINAQHMSDSKVAAAAAALQYLRIPGVRVTGDGARIERVLEDKPAAEGLQAGDVIVAVDGQPVTTSTDLTVLIQKPAPGSRLRITVKRGEERIEVPIRSVPSDDDSKRPVIGVQVVTIGQRIDLPFQIEISSGGIGGPSAGLMFALAIIDQLEEGELANGRDVAGTGVISLDGTVGEVGGVRQKAAAAERAGAEVFLVPRREVDDAKIAAKRIQIIGVSNLADAVEALRGLQQPVSATGDRKN